MRSAILTKLLIALCGVVVAGAAYAAGGLFLGGSSGQAGPGGPGNSGIALNMGTNTQVFVNYLLGLPSVNDGLSLANSSLNTYLTTETVDANGYPEGILTQALAAGLTNAMPNTTYTGAWVFDWCGQFSTNTIKGVSISGIASLPTITGTTGAGTTASLSGNTILIGTGGKQQGSVTFTVANPTAFTGPIVNFLADSAQGGTGAVSFDFTSGGACPNTGYVRLYRVDQGGDPSNPITKPGSLIGVNNNGYNVFNPDYIADLKAMKPNVLRFMDSLGTSMPHNMNTRYGTAAQGGQQAPVTALGYGGPFDWFPGGSSNQTNSYVSTNDCTSADGGTTYVTAGQTNRWADFVATVSTSGSTVTVTSGSPILSVNQFVNINGVPYIVKTALSAGSFTVYNDRYGNPPGTQSGVSMVVDGAMTICRIATANNSNMPTLNVASSGAFPIMQPAPSVITCACTSIFNANVDGSGNVTVNYGNKAGSGASGGWPGNGGFLTVNGTKACIASFTDISHFAIKQADCATTWTTVLNKVWVGGWASGTGQLIQYTTYPFQFDAENGIWFPQITTTGTAHRTATNQGLPLEAQVALCNQVNANCWFNLPFWYDVPSVQREVAYVRDNLNSNLSGYFEWSLETFNYWSGYFSLLGQYFTGSTGAGTGCAGDVFNCGPNSYIGWRLALVMPAILTTWTQNGRSASTLRRIVTWQGAPGALQFDQWVATGQAILVANGFPTNYDGVTVPHQPIPIAGADAIATASYINGAIVGPVLQDWTGHNRPAQWSAPAASISGTTLTIPCNGIGPLAGAITATPGASVTGTGVTAGTYIVQQLSGSFPTQNCAGGSSNTYQINNNLGTITARAMSGGVWSGSASVTGTTMTVTAVSGNALYPGSFYNLNSGASVGTIQAQLTMAATWSCTSCSIALSGGVPVMTVNSGLSGTPALGDIVNGSGVTANTWISKVITAGVSYQVSLRQTVSGTMTGANPYGAGTYLVVSSGNSGSGPITGSYNGGGAPLVAADLYQTDAADAYNTLDIEARYGTLMAMPILNTPKILVTRTSGDCIGAVNGGGFATEANTYGIPYMQYEGGYQTGAIQSGWVGSYGGSWAGTAKIDNGSGGSGNILTVTAMTSGQIYYGAPVTGGTVAANTWVTGQLTGTPGQIGTYQVNQTQAAVASASLSGSNISSFISGATGGYVTDNNQINGLVQQLLNAYKHDNMFKQLILDYYHTFIACGSNNQIPAWYNFQPGINVWPMAPLTFDQAVGASPPSPLFKSYDASVAFGAGL